MDFSAMRLAAGGNPAELDRILQLEMRHKHGAKLHTTLSCPDFRFPNSLSGEQSTGDDLAEIHAGLVEPGTSVLDMTCGLGIDTFHIARKAAHVTACELQPEVAQAARDNAAALGITNVEIVTGDSASWLAETDRRYHTIFIDPARRSDSGGRLYGLSQCKPDVVELLPLLLSRCRQLIIKASPMLDVSRTFEELGRDTDILLIGTQSECKELVAIIPGTGRVKAITAGCHDFEFSLADEAAAGVSYQSPAEGLTILEPSPSMMKSGGMKMLAKTFGLTKIAPDTHLLLSAGKPEKFPGKAYEILAAMPFDKRGIRTMKTLASEGAEVAVRNMGGITAAELRKRLGVKEGSDARIYGVRDAAGKRLIVYTRKLTA